MGDVIHTLPAAQALRDAFPEAMIGWLIEERWADLLCAPGTPRAGPAFPATPFGGLGSHRQLDWMAEDAFHCTHYRANRKSLERCSLRPLQHRCRPAGRNPFRSAHAMVWNARHLWFNAAPGISCEPVVHAESSAAGDACDRAESVAGRRSYWKNRTCAASGVSPRRRRREIELKSFSEMPACRISLS